MDRGSDPRHAIRVIRRFYTHEVFVVDPKMFYRELDSLLAKIGHEKSGENFFQSILSELQIRFGPALSIRCSFLFEKRGDAFALIHTQSDREGTEIVRHIGASEPAIKALLKHGSYIYDQGDLSGAFQIRCHAHVTPAAISIHMADRFWLFVFALGDGWVREETLLFLNAVRTALNYRIFSELMDNELTMAEEIQKSLLPHTGPDVPGFDIAHFSQPAESVGGDFYDYFQFDTHSFGVSLGDASGHGLPAALLSRDVVIGLRMGLNVNTRVLRTIKRLNRVIQRSTYSTNFVSLFIGEIEDFDHLFYVNAGHPPPFLLSGKSCHALEATGIALGFLPDVNWHRNHIPFRRGDTLVIYSDGIIERERNPEEQFGIRRLQKLVMQNRNLSASDLVVCVYRAVFEFGGKKAWVDDATLVVIKRLMEPVEIPDRDSDGSGEE
ncbi:MAG TPA: hypothetical protein ENN17_10255 [bacterium]|nr:hypothetical protein [bacterium]